MLTTVEQPVHTTSEICAVRLLKVTFLRGHADARAGIASTEARIPATSGEMVSALSRLVVSGGTGRAMGFGHAKVSLPKVLRYKNDRDSTR